MDWRVREIEVLRICVELAQYSRSHEGRSSLDYWIQEDTWQRSVRFGRNTFHKETRVKVVKSLKPNLRRGLAQGCSLQLYETKEPNL